MNLVSDAIKATTGSEYGWFLNEIVREVMGGEIKDPSKPIIYELECSVAQFREICRRFLCKEDAYCRLWKMQFSKSSRMCEDQRTCTMDDAGLTEFENFALTKRRFSWIFDAGMSAQMLMHFRFRLRMHSLVVLKTLDDRVLRTYAQT